MSTPSGVLKFVAFHKPAVLDGEYTLTVQQQVKIDGKFGWGNDQWSSAPSTKLQFAVAGPRFSLDPDLVQSQFPPPKSSGEYYSVLPHIILNRTTLPWERTIDNSSPTKTTQPTSWLALLLFDHVGDNGAPSLQTLKVQDLADLYRDTGNPPGKPEFVKVLPWESKNEPQRGELKLEVGQHPEDRLTVIDVAKHLLWQILPTEEELVFLSHIRLGQDATDPTKDAEYPVILCNRLPAAGSVSNGAATGTQSTVHLVSLEARQPLLDELKTEPTGDSVVRLVSLASWSFSTLQRDKTFSAWIKEAWCPDAQRTGGNDPTQPGHCATGVLHTLRMPSSNDSDAERFLAQGYVPIKHQTRQGNHLVSWYRSPLLPGQSLPADVTLPVRTSDELVRYFSDVAMFDTTYAAAWELGRMLTLRSKKVSLALFNWKRANAQQINQAEEAVTHLPFAPDHSVAPGFPEQVTQWFEDLLSLNHVPFHYLVPREEMLPVNSLRFFHVDINWLECLLDGAFSVGRVTSLDITHDHNARKSGKVPPATIYSGFLLRSPVVSGWPNLGVEAYSQAVPEKDGYLPDGITPVQRLRFDRVGDDVLLCLFAGEIKTVDIHEHPDTIHFGVDPGNDPGKIDGYKKALRNKTNGALGPEKDLPLRKSGKRVINIKDLATAGQSDNSADFGVTMIQGVEKVRFIK